MITAKIGDQATATIAKRMSAISGTTYIPKDYPGVDDEKPLAGAGTPQGLTPI
jgi:hypothetical protein